MLELVTAYQEVLSRDFQVDSAVRNRLDPTNANAVEAGEFAAILTTNPNRVTFGSFTGTIGTGVTGATLPTNETMLYQVFTERGRYDVQAIDKITMLWGRPYEGVTNVFDATAAIFVGQPLTVKTGTQAAVANRLVLRPAAAGDVVYGWALNAVAISSTPLSTVRLNFRLEGPLFVAA